MQKEYTKLLSEILNKMANTDHIRPGDIPDIDLYMDQVTHFMDEHLEHSKRYEDDKILTKTMINNYTKNKLLPPPEKKRYTKEHMLVLIFIYYFKSFRPLGDIQAILNRSQAIFSILIRITIFRTFIPRYMHRGRSRSERRFAISSTATIPRQILSKTVRRKTANLCRYLLLSAS